MESLLDRFDLDGDADRRIETYSKGMKQKLGLVQALMHNPMSSSSMNRRRDLIRGRRGRCVTPSAKSRPPTRRSSLDAYPARR